MTPVGLEEHCVDLLEIDGFGAVAHGFDERADAEVFDGPERAFRAACDEVEGFIREGGVRQADAVELGVDEFDEVGGGWSKKTHAPHLLLVAVGVVAARVTVALDGSRLMAVRAGAVADLDEETQELVLWGQSPQLNDWGLAGWV